MCVAMSGHSTAWPTPDDTTMSRRAPGLRSMSGPSSGETMAKGAIVSRYNSTLWSAASERGEEERTRQRDRDRPRRRRAWRTARARAGRSGVFGRTGRVGPAWPCP